MAFLAFWALSSLVFFWSAFFLVDFGFLSPMIGFPCRRGARRMVKRAKAPPKFEEIWFAFRVFGGARKSDLYSID